MILLLQKDHGAKEHECLHELPTAEEASDPQLEYEVYSCELYGTFHIQPAHGTGIRHDRTFPTPFVS